MRAPERPLVLCFSGHDPTGGAGIHADIEAVGANGAHALTLITAHTAQDTENVSRVSAVAPILLAAQVQALLGDCRIAAIKLGLLGDSAQIPVILSALDQARVPLVMDPILRAGGGTALTSASLQAAIQEQLLPRVDVLTPNTAEARRLARDEDLDTCAARLLGMGVKNVLITGGEEPGSEVCNRWYRPGADVQVFRWPRLAGSFHGAGCTMASALAARLACGDSTEEALLQAQAYTHETLQRAIAIGQGRKIPLRRP